MRITFIFFIFLLFFNKNSFCNSLFDTDFNEVNFTSNNIDLEKQKRINEIKLINIKKIFNNILNRNDYNLIKRNIDENFTNSFIKNIVFKDEKIINNNYFSNIQINFDKNKIINFLRKEKLSYVEFYPENFISIIYEKRKISKNLFSKKNNSHYEYLMSNEKLLNFYNLPKFDINDRFLLNSNDIENLDLNKINKFQNKYSNNDLLFIISEEFDEYIYYSIYIYTKKSLYLVKNIKVNDYDYELLFNSIYLDILDAWKTNNKIQNENLLNIYCSISYFNLLELKEIRENLQNISIIKRILLKKISYKNNYYDFYFYGDQYILNKLFLKNNLKINFNDNNCKINLK